MHLKGAVYTTRALYKTGSRAISPMMEAVSASETSVNVYQTTRCNTVGNSLLYTGRRKNLKSHLIEECLFCTIVLVFLTYCTHLCS
jgi:hypothetical protein